MHTNGMKKVEKVEKNNDKVVKYYTDGSIEICCANGHRKEISPDGKTTKVFYNNGDIKETLPCGLVKYFYSGVKTWHFKYEDGREVTQFNNGKTETKFPDGTIVIDEANGDSIILLPNGQKEEHTSQYKKREYPDGTVKIVYEDGRQETRYGTGTPRTYENQGNLVFDSSS
jgi:centromere protein J